MDPFAEYGGGQGSDAGSSKQPITEEGAPQGQGDSIHIPAEFLQGQKFKPGDELVLKVMSADDEGVEVEYAQAPAKEGEGEMSANDEIDQMHQGGEGMA